MIPKRALLVSGTFFLALLLYIDRVCISTAKDPITAALNLTDKQFGWIMSAFALGYALFQTPSGVLADKLGPRGVLAGIVAIWSLFTGLTAAAWNYGSMLVIRFLFGAGEAGAYPAMARAFYSWMPMKERGLATGINFAGGRLGAMFAMPLIATLITTLGWKQTFAVLMVVGFVWSVAWYRWFRGGSGIFLRNIHPSAPRSATTFLPTASNRASRPPSCPSRR
jgi:ACS family glucarate transporter-like MFS transporter